MAELHSYCLIDGHLVCPCLQSTAFIWESIRQPHVAGLLLSSNSADGVFAFHEYFVLNVAGSYRMPTAEVVMR